MFEDFKLKDIQILLVDDSEFDRRAAHQVLKAIGLINIQAANSGEDAIQILKNHDSFDLILCDVHMDGMDGIAVAEWVRSHPVHNATPIAFLSSDTNEDMVASAFAQGAQDYCFKPLRKTEVSARIRSLLSLRREMKLRQKYTDDISKLLRRVLPQQLAEELETFGHVQPRECNDASIIYLGFAGYSQLFKEHKNEDILHRTEIFFDAFDTLAEAYEISRIKTVGDEWQGVTGLFGNNITAALRIALFAQDVQYLLGQVNDALQKRGQITLAARAGVHTGSVVYGVMGTKRLQFDIYGDAANYTKRICDAAVADEICASEAFRKKVKPFAFGWGEAKHLIAKHGLKVQAEVLKSSNFKDRSFRIMTIFPGIKAIHPLLVELTEQISQAQ